MSVTSLVVIVVNVLILLGIVYLIAKTWKAA